MKKFLLAVSFFAFAGLTASYAQTTTTKKEEVKVESTAPKTCSGTTTAPKTCSGGSTVNNTEAPKTCCSSSNKTSCSGTTTMTSADGGKTTCDPKTCDHKDKKKTSGKKGPKTQSNGSSCISPNSNKPCCSGH